MNPYELELVSFRLGEQLFGIPVSGVQEVVPAQPLASVPRSNSALAGLLNLRGQIVTAIDLRNRLNIKSDARPESSMNIVVSDRGELFSLLVDAVGDVLSVESSRLETAPGTLHGKLKDVCQGVCRMEEGLVLVVDVPAILDIGSAECSADYSNASTLTNQER
jgi:purine-binding chemotaxis protein CheW